MPISLIQANPYLSLLDEVIERQARLLAQWWAVGFVRGVMNTDSMALSGETIDYGPCAFMEAYDPATVFSSIDTHGRYAFGNQPSIAQWNLARFAETLLPLLHPKQDRAISLAEEVLGRFPARFRHHWLQRMRGKLGLFTEEEEDAALVNQLLEWMKDSRADYTNTFGRLPRENGLNDDATFRAWHERWTARLDRQPQSRDQTCARMQAHSPAVIPRNHKVEEALAAAEAEDYGVMHRLLDALRDPYNHDRVRAEEYLQPAPNDALPYRTFCGT